IRANAAKLSEGQLSEARAALSEAIVREGFKAASFGPAFALIDTLTLAARGDFAALDWRKALPQTSSWRFVLDHFFGVDPLVASGFITPIQKITTYEQKEALLRELTVPGTKARFSGWTFT